MTEPGIFSSVQSDTAAVPANSLHRPWIYRWEHSAITRISTHNTSSDRISITDFPLDIPALLNLDDTGATPLSSLAT